MPAKGSTAGAPDASTLVHGAAEWLRLLTGSRSRIHLQPHWRPVVSSNAAEELDDGIEFGAIEQITDEAAYPLGSPLLQDVGVEVRRLTAALRANASKLECASGDIREHLKNKDRKIRAEIEVMCRPMWAGLVQSEIPLLQRIGRQRPKALRGEGAYWLPHIMQAISTEADAEVLAAALREVHHQRTSDPLVWLTSAFFANARRWAEAHPGQLREQLKRGRFIDVASNINGWCNLMEWRAELRFAGTVVASLPSGELRLMAARDLDALGGYLDCCIGSGAYPLRAEALSSAFVCVYRDDMPVGVAELLSDEGRVWVEETQGRFERDPDEVWVDELHEFLKQPDMHSHVARWLGTTPGAAAEIHIRGDADCAYWWDETTDRFVPFGQIATYNYDEVIEGVLTGETSYRAAYDNLEEHIGKGCAQSFRESLIDVCRVDPNQGIAGLIIELT